MGASRGFQLNFQFWLSANSHKIEFFAKIYSIFRPFAIETLFWFGEINSTNPYISTIYHGDIEESL